MQSEILKPRLCYIDNLRVLACFLVLLTHSTMPAIDPEREGVWMFGISFIGSPFSELFLALSGTVLLPVRIGIKQFYKRRFAKLLPPLFIWSTLGIALYTVTQDMSWNEALSKIIRIPLQPAIGVYWFVYAMAGLYLLAPFISPWLNQSSKRQIELFLGLCSINMLLPWIIHFIPNLTSAFKVDGNYYWALCYFGGFLSYWLLGVYLKRYPIKIGFNLRWLILFVGMIAYPIAIYLIKLKGGDVEVLLGNLQIGSVFFVAFLYTIMQNIRLSVGVQRVLTRIAKYSFGIYLTHIYIARELYWNIFSDGKIHIFPRTFIIALLTLLTGYLLTYLLSLIPKGKYITGV
ncbi:MAG: acyltransferase [Paramuribaculum sp.]|nr:acyltransferase [Paramuribaculum sp.]MDE6304239.1 acyltransferase [Paramuribaculum sp.]